VIIPLLFEPDILDPLVFPRFSFPFDLDLLLDLLPLFAFMETATKNLLNLM